MRAAFLTEHGEADVLQVGELPTPEPQAGEVRVRLQHSSLNHLDIWVRRGLPNLKLQYPHVLGSDGAGIVDGVGAGVTGWKNGDPVIVHPGVCSRESLTKFHLEESLAPDYKILGEHISGTNAQYVCVPEENIFRIPTTLSLSDAASIGLTFTTAWQMVVRKARVREGEYVLVHAGASGVSSAAIQIAKGLKARVVSTAGSPEKRELAKTLGADLVLDYQDPDWFKQAKAFAKSEGIQVILDHVGASVWEANLRCLSWGGRFVTCGASSGAKVSFDMRHLFYKQWQFLGSTMGAKSDFPAILDGFERGMYRPVVSEKRFALSEIQEAHRSLEQRTVLGKLVLDLG